MVGALTAATVQGDVQADIHAIHVVFGVNLAVRQRLPAQPDTPQPAPAGNLRPGVGHGRAHVGGRGANPRRIRLSHMTRLRMAQAWYSWHCAAACPTRRARRQPW